MNDNNKMILVPQCYASKFNKSSKVFDNIVFYDIRHTENRSTKHIPHKIKRLFNISKRIIFEQYHEKYQSKKIYGVILNWNAQEEDLRLILQLHSNIEWVHCIHAGLDHLPIDMLFNQGITLTSGKGLKATTIAEYAIGLIYLKAKRFLLHTSPHQNTIIRSEPLNQSKLLVFGAGSIGSRISELARANGMHTLGVNRSGNNNGHFERVIKFSEFTPSNLSVNFVVIAAPLTTETRNYFNASFFKSIKNPIHIINISRDNLIDLRALSHAMKTGRVLSAAIDTDKTRCKSILKANKNIILTNHSAFASTVEAHEQIERAEQNALCFINKQQLHGVISPDKGY